MKLNGKSPLRLGKKPKVSPAPEVRDLGIVLDGWQEDFLKTEGDKILCTGRQVGKSVVCSIDAGEWAKSHKNQNILMIAPTERQAYALFDKTLDYLMRKYPNLIKMGKDRPTKTKLILKNGVNIYCLPTGQSGLGIRGLTIGRLYVDEASQVAEGVWAAITPMLLTTGGDTILLSTPFGARGEFYRVWVNEDNLYDSYTRFSIDSEKVMRERPINQSWTELTRERALLKLEREKGRMSRREYAQEYLGKFVEDLSRFFSDELIAKCCVLKKNDSVNFSHNYFLGVDIARLGDDESCFSIIDKIDREHLIQVDNIITRKQLTTETEDKIIFLNTLYDFQKIYIDAGSGSLGVGVFDHLLRNEQTGRKVDAINNRKVSLNRDESQKTRLLKEDLYDNLRSLMERNFVKLLDDENLIESLRSIQYEYISDEGQPTKIRIFGNYSHCAESLIRAVWCVKDKNLNIWVRSIKG